MGYNMFAYCNNNPVAYYDERGRSLVATEFMLKDDVSSGGQVTVLVVSNNHEDWIDSSQTMGEDFANAIGANNVVVYPATDETFAEVWNSTNADYVIIHTHGTPTNITGEDFSFSSLDSGLLSENARIEGVVITACLTGGVPGFGKNIATIFSEKISSTGIVLCCTTPVNGDDKKFAPCDGGKWVIYQSRQKADLTEHAITMEFAATIMR